MLRTLLTVSCALATVLVAFELPRFTFPLLCTEDAECQPNEFCTKTRHLGDFVKIKYCVLKREFWGENTCWKHSECPDGQECGPNNGTPWGLCRVPPTNFIIEE